VSEIRVLVVDDSRQMREFVVECVLKPNGFEADEAANGAEAIEKALPGHFDLMLLDLEMPKMTGFEVLDTLHTHSSGLPVVLMTSHGSESIAVEVFRKGVRDYVIKPFTAEEMLEVIGHALTEVQLQKEKEALTTRLMQANRQLEQRLHELHTFYQIGKSVTALMDREQLLDRIVDAALYITGAEGGALLLQDDDTGELLECVRKQRSRGQEKQLSSRTESELAADAVRKGDATMTAAMLYAPLKIGDHSIGALGVSNKVTSRFFNDHDRRLLVSLADYAAVALENISLLLQIEEAKEREKQQIRGLFERYVAPSVVEKLMVRPDTVQLGGVRQDATVLFADIRGFSDFSVRSTPEVLVDVLNYHIAVATQAILAESGTLDKFLGDGVMAYFNAPLPQQDHALRAVRAAWRLCRMIEASHKKLAVSSRFHFGVGISTGEVLVGNIGAPQMMNFTVIGDVVNVGRRLQENARGGQILISRQVHDVVQDRVEAMPVGELEFKGHAKPEPVFEVISVEL
jgi:class 3 adenylate cyclase/DNA-binding response OmpR family regulator